MHSGSARRWKQVLAGPAGWQAPRHV